MKKYFRDLSIAIIAATFFLCVQHAMFFHTYATLEEMCKVIK
jgi:hypothetical protein